MYLAIKQLILSISNYYNNNNIFQGYQNNWTPPQDSVFVVMSELDTTSMAMMPLIEYDATQDITTLVELDSTDFQVDFYGVNARAQAAQFRLIIQSPSGTNYLFDNYQLSVHRVMPLANLTNILDRRNYTPRFTVRFSLFNNNITSGSDLGFISDEPDIRLAEIQTLT